MFSIASWEVMWREAARPRADEPAALLSLSAFALLPDDRDGRFAAVLSSEAVAALRRVAPDLAVAMSPFLAAVDGPVLLAARPAVRASLAESRVRVLVEVRAADSPLATLRALPPGAAADLPAREPAAVVRTCAASAPPVVLRAAVFPVAVFLFPESEVVDLRVDALEVGLADLPADFAGAFALAPLRVAAVLLAGVRVTPRAEADFAGARLVVAFRADALPDAVRAADPALVPMPAAWLALLLVEVFLAAVAFLAAGLPVPVFVPADLRGRVVAMRVSLRWVAPPRRPIFDNTGRMHAR